MAEEEATEHHCCHEGSEDDAEGYMCFGSDGVSGCPHRRR